MEGTQALPLSMWGNTKQAYTYPDSIKNKLAMISLKGTHFLADDKLIAIPGYFLHEEYAAQKNEMGCEIIFVKPGKNTFPCIVE